MPLRMTGMMSGMDTESIIQDLVSVRRKKVDVKKKAQTKLEWKQDAWKELNQKLKNLQSKYISNMRFASSYSKKVSKVSNSSAVSVITGDKAVNGVQSLQVKELAKTGYLTGAAIKGKDGELTALSKLSDIEGFSGMPESGTGTITFKAGSKSVDLQVDENTTISDLLTQAKSIGLNANFDAKNQRIFISAKESGKSNDFSITASDANGAEALKALGLQANIADDKATKKEYEDLAKLYDSTSRENTLDNMRGMIDDAITARKNSCLEEYKELQDSKKAANDKKTEILNKYASESLGGIDEYQTALDAKNADIEAKKQEMEGITDPEQKRAAEEELVRLQQEAQEIDTKLEDAKTLKAQDDNLASYEERLTALGEKASITDNGDGTYTVDLADNVTEGIEDSFYKKASYAAAVDGGTISVTGGATKVSGEDAVILLNGAEFTNNTNTFEINGLTITALAKTAPGEEVTITTEQDTDGIYDMVKNFLKEYNAIVNEMDKLYNADLAKGYEPLLDDEKESMSESEIKKWEDKIKDSLLRRDENLSAINSGLQGVMSSGIEINGKTMYLSDFGIELLGYFTAPDNEKHAYHIDGDPDDEFTSGNSDKLKNMIANDPSTVISFFTKMSQNLYAKMSDMSKSVENTRSYGNFYDDKKMKSDYSDYTKKIAEMEEKLGDYEDMWYRKFSKMETALAKLQSNMTAVTGLFGGGS